MASDERREMLRDASQKVETSSPQSPKSPAALVRAPSGAGETESTAGTSVRHAHQSYSKRLVWVKKGDAGGMNEPNYDSSEEPYKLVGTTGADPKNASKKAIISIIEKYFSTAEYFSTAAVDVAASSLIKLGSNEYYPYVIKRLVSMAIKRHDKEKEMASVLLSKLYGPIITPEQISDGFFLLIESADDLAADIPDAVDILAIFLARAVVDVILPPVFLVRAKKALPESSKGSQVIQTAQKTYLSAPHHAELVKRRWGGTTYLTAQDVKKKIDDLLKGYADNGDICEACRHIRELGVPFFHHEVVKRALTFAIEIKSAESLILKLLKEAAEGLISSDQILKGFSRMRDVDLTLCIPSAKASFKSLVLKATMERWLDSSFLKPSGGDGDIQVEDEKVREYKKDILTIIDVYFLDNDILEVIQSLEGLRAVQYNPIFVKQLITLAMDRRNSEREMASVLLSALHMEILTQLNIVDGFVMLLEIAEDTALDAVGPSNELALFLARSVIDGTLTHMNLDEISSRLPPKCSGSETVTLTRSLLAASHAGERLLGCWGVGATGWAGKNYQDKITKILNEYESKGAKYEACWDIRELGMPYFNHEVVKKALVMAIEKNESMLDLLEECFSYGGITVNHMTKGFTRTKGVLDDLLLDGLEAKEKFDSYVQHALRKGWLYSII